MLIWPILKPLSFEKGELACDSAGFALFVVFLTSLAYIVTLVTDGQLQFLIYSIKLLANLAEPSLFRCKPCGFR